VNDYLGPDHQWRVVWIGPPDELELVFITGMQAPGCAPGVVFTNATFIVHNDAGEIGFKGTLLGPGVTSANYYGHWQGPPGALRKVACSSEPAADMPAGVTYKQVPAGGVAFNAAGQTGEIAYIQGSGVAPSNDVVRYVGNSDGLYAVLREGQPAPLEVGPDVTVLPGSSVLINDRGEELGSVQYAGPGITDANKWAVYFGPIGAPRQVMRDGDPAPGFPDGTTLVLAGALPALAALNRVGDIVGITEIAGPGVTDEDKLVLWMRPHALRRWNRCCAPATSSAVAPCMRPTVWN